LNGRFLNMLQITLAAVDLISINLAVWMSRIFFDERIPDKFGQQYTYLWLSINISWLLVCATSGLYHQKFIKTFLLPPTADFQNFHHCLSFRYWDIAAAQQVRVPHSVSARTEKKLLAKKGTDTWV
jgi:hypothetical protein